MKKTNKLLALLLSVLLVFSLTATAFAADSDVIANGGDGVNTTWTLTKDGTLTVSGNGPIMDQDEIEYDENGEVSSINKLDCIGWQINEVWDKLTANMSAGDAARTRFDFVKTLVIEEGVTEIPSSEFSDLFPRTIVLPASLQTLGYEAVDASYCEKLTIANPNLEVFGNIRIAAYAKGQTPYGSIDEAIDASVAYEAASSELSAKLDILYDLETAYGILKKVNTDTTKKEFLAYFNETHGKTYTTLKSCINCCIKRVNRLFGTSYTTAEEILEIVSFDGEKFVQRKQEISDKIDALYEKISIEGRMEHDYLGSYGYEDVTAYQWLTVYAPAGTETEESCKISGVPFVSTTPVDNSPLGKIKAFFAKVKAFFEDIIAKLTAPLQMAKLVLESKLQNG